MTPLATITQNDPRLMALADHARRTRRAPNPRQRVGGAQPGTPYPKQRLRLAYPAASPARSAINPTGYETQNQPRLFTPLIDAKAASGLLGVPYTWLLAQAREGRIPHHRLGHYVRFDPDDLQAWLQETKAAPRDGHSQAHRRGR
jgi:excisionase family DNA binding protein